MDHSLSLTFVATLHGDMIACPICRDIHNHPCRHLVRDEADQSLRYLATVYRCENDHDWVFLQTADHGSMYADVMTLEAAQDVLVEPATEITTNKFGGGRL